MAITVAVRNRTTTRVARLIAGATAFAITIVLTGCGGDRPTATSPAATDPAAVPAPSQGLRLLKVTSGLGSPIQVVGLPGPGQRLLILEQSGRVRIVEDGTLMPDPVLDISNRVKSGGEQGLLSLALHPKFDRNGLVYLHLSGPDGDTRVEEHTFASGRIAPDPTRVLLEVDQPFANHNGGSLAFGPDGKLYLGLGDGGSANDPNCNAQNLQSRLGKLLRRDVDAAGGDWEIAAYGLRNPWRFAFDPDTGDAWIGDVGQGDWEEVDVFAKGADLLNYGWDVYEGTKEADKGDRGDLNNTGSLTEPVAQYDHDAGCSITGGVVVRNARLPALDGRYVYGDYCSGTIWSIPAADGQRQPRLEPITVERLVSFDAAPDGTVYVTSQSGTVQRLAPAG